MRLTLLALIILLLTLPASAQTPPPPDLPPVQVITEAGAYPGVLYVGNYDLGNGEPTAYNSYVFKVNGAGEVVFWQRAEGRPFNFTRHLSGEMGYYALARSDYPRGVGWDGSLILLDDSGGTLATYQTVGDLARTSQHDQIALPDGTVILMSQEDRYADLTAQGGLPDAIVIDIILQAQDANGNVLWEWNAADLYPIEDAAPDIDLTADVVPYIHINSMSLTPDGNLLISARNQDEVTLLDIETGQVIWRMGGAANQFQFINDPLNGFSHQHAAQILPNGNLLLFDNGNLHNPPTTRAAEYEIDTTRRIARLVWEYRLPAYADATGSVQRLPNGNTLIGWGSAGQGGNPAATEVTPAGEVVQTLYLPPDQLTYRVWKFDD